MKLGILAGMALSQVGVRFPVMCNSVMKHICGTHITEIEPSITQVADPSKQKLTIIAKIGVYDRLVFVFSRAFM